MLQGLSELLAEYDVLAAFWMTIKLTVAAAIGALRARHHRCDHAGISSCSVQVRRDGVRHAGAQHTLDTDRVLLCLRVLHHLAVPDRATELTHRCTELPLGGPRTRDLPRGFCRGGAAEWYQHRPQGSGRGR